MQRRRSCPSVLRTIDSRCARRTHIIRADDAHPVRSRPAPCTRNSDSTASSRTLRALQDRIDARFPGAGLGRVARELTTVGETTAPLLEKVRRPNLYLRTGVGLVILLLVAVVISLVMRFQGLRADIDGFSSLLQTIESGIQDVVFLSAAIYFMATIEGRLKRKTVLENLHRLRSIVHVI